jgi:excisionase family DNA binding protein
MEKEILSIADASQLLSLSEAEVERLLVAGELPGRRVGSHWFIARQRLIQHISGDDLAVNKPPPAHVIASPKSLPPKLLMPDWRCDSCHEIHGPEFAECPRCGSIRNTPLMGYRMPHHRTILSINTMPKVN